MNRFFLLFLAAAVTAFAQDYSGTTTPSLNDSDVILLRKIAKTLNDARTGSAPLASAANGSQVAPAFTSATASGATTAGKKILIFILSSDFVGTIGGVAFTGAADATLELRAPEGSTFAAVAYTRSAGTIRLVQF